jgi:biopolymer transport protein ExbD
MMRRELMQVELQIAPLIDVCFLLLFFFMATARPKFTHSHIDAAVASVGTTDQSFPPIEEQTIQILDNGQVLWNDAVVGRPESKDLLLLSTSLQRLKSIADRSNSSVSIVIDPDDKAPYQRIIDVMVACRRSGVTDITLATEPHGGG